LRFFCGELRLKGDVGWKNLLKSAKARLSIADTGAEWPKAFASLQTDLKAGLTGGSAATGTSGSTFSNTLTSVLSGLGITF